MGGFDDDDPKLPLLRLLGLDRTLHFVDVGDLYEVRGAAVGEPFVLPHGAEAALAAATLRFPEHRAGLDAYFKRLAALRGAGQWPHGIWMMGAGCLPTRRKHCASFGRFCAMAEQLWAR
jgi:hypothetical protein